MLPTAAIHQGHAAAAAARAKRHKYCDKPEAVVFIPLAIEVYGCMNSAFDAFLRRCAYRCTLRKLHKTIVDPAPGAILPKEALRCRAFFRQRVSIALQHSQALLIHRRGARAVGGGSSSRRAQVSHLLDPADLYVALPYMFALACCNHSVTALVRKMLSSLTQVLCRHPRLS